MAVATAAYVTHMNKRRIDDQLVVVDTLIQNNPAEGLDKLFTTGNAQNS